MLKKIEGLKELIGNTPVMNLKSPDIDLFVKLEYANLTGSIKDRAAFYIISEAIREGRINQYTTIVESSSGNFAIALACICRHLGLEFIPVIDPNIVPGYEKLLNLLVSKVIKVEERDRTGGYLLTRINTVEQLLKTETNIFWTNQYENPNNFKAYFKMADEINQSLPRLDYLFIGVSSGGTIIGLSQRLKEHNPALKIVAVDVEGSVIFDQKPKKRHVSGIGSSKKPIFMPKAVIDDIIHVSEADIVNSCHALLKDHTVFGGASAGASYAAVKSYFSNRRITHKPKVLFLCPDRGSSYIDTIYNDEWCANEILLEIASSDL